MLWEEIVRSQPVMWFTAWTLVLLPLFGVIFWAFGSNPHLTPRSKIVKDEVLKYLEEVKKK